ncbi:HNH endonuclease [Rhodococcus spongiicola]|nr:HNH endonuclease signature motif containing protein [Rhodococcus spongiicola]
MNCGESTKDSMHRKYCCDGCRVAFERFGGPRPKSTPCVACGAQIDLTEVTKGGQRKRRTTKFCRRCVGDYDKYKMSARQLALRDGAICGICGGDVDMSLSRKDDGAMCPSVDHIVPRSLGGSHDPSNLQLAHMVCNMRKSDRVRPVA